MTNPCSLKGRVVLITGASSGIGRASAVKCAAMGASLCVTGRDVQRLQETVDMLEGDGHSMLTCDITKPTDIDALVAALPQLDGIVHCAGTLSSMPTRFVNVDVAQPIFDVNFFAFTSLISAILQQKRLLRGASIVIVTSVSADSAVEAGNAVYSASKAALSAYARVLAKELAKKHIRVNCIAPGMIETPLITNFDADEVEMDANRAKYPFGFGSPDDVAWAAVYLLSDMTKWMTGSTLRIDGGLSLNN